MPSKTRVVIHLPNPNPTVELPQRLAETPQRIIKAGPHGVSSISLLEAGIVSALNNVAMLRKLGAHIETERGSAIGRHGQSHPGTAHYFCKGWIEAKPVDWDMVARK